MSLQRKINRQASRRKPPAFVYPDRVHRGITVNCPPEVINHPDKGHRDGSCNRTACQRPLAGQVQFWMVDYGKAGGRLYYCAECEREFTRWDKIDRPGQPLRCSPDEANGIRRFAQLVEFESAPEQTTAEFVDGLKRKRLLRG